MTTSRKGGWREATHNISFGNQKQIVSLETKIRKTGRVLENLRLLMSISGIDYYPPSGELGINLDMLREIDKLGLNFLELPF